MTPGAYLRQCREAAGLTVYDVALRTETTPAIALREREEIIRALEADVVTLSVVDAGRLRPIYKFDWLVMERAEVPAGQIARHGLALRSVA